MEYHRQKLSPGVCLTHIRTDKFKTSMLGLAFIEPLREETAATNALLPPLLRRGCARYPDMLSLSAALDELYGASIEPMLRKKGELQCLGFLGSFLDEAYLPKGEEILPSAVALMAELLCKPAQEGEGFVADFAHSEQENLLRRIRSRINDKQQYAIYRLLREMYGEEPFAQDKLGEESRAAALTPALLWARYAELLAQAPLEIYYCGSAPLERVEALWREALAPLLDKPRESPATEQEQPKKEIQPRYLDEALDITQGKLVLGFRLNGPCRTAKHLACAQIFNAIYGGSTNAKLFLNVRERLSLCYYASSMVETHKGMLLVSSGVAFDQHEKARDEILAQLDDCRKGKITGEELSFARSYYCNRLRLTEDAQGSLEDFWMDQAAAGSQIAPAAIIEAAMDITQEDVQAFAQTIALDCVYFLKGKEGAAT